MLLLTRVLILSMVCAGSAFAAAPVVTDATATPLAGGNATVEAKVTANGAFTTVTFNYGPDIGYGTSRTVSVPGSAVDQTVSVSLIDLVGGEEYHFRATASNSFGDSDPTSDQTFTEQPYGPRLQISAPLNRGGGNVTFRGTVTANGTGPGKVFFRYTEAATGIVVETSEEPVAADTIGKTLEAQQSGLKRDVAYSVQLVHVTDVGGVTTSTPFLPLPFTLVNFAPVAAADTYNVTARAPTSLDVLKNDRDRDGEALLLASVTKPEHGAARVVGRKVIYTPDASFRGRDTFDYEIEDAVGGFATGTVTIRSPGASAIGLHAGLVKDEKGRDVGLFEITVLPSGAFTGSLKIDGKSHGFKGVLDADGKFHSTITIDGDRISFALNATQDELGTRIIASFAGGSWTSEASFLDTESTQRTELAGRYTVQLPGGADTSGPDPAPGQPVVDQSDQRDTHSLPEGTGWAAIKIREDGTAKVKGRLPDGNSFSTRGVLVADGDGPRVLFCDEVDDSRVVASLSLSDSVGGNLRIVRPKSSDELFPRGYDVTIGATGGAYVPTENGVTGGETEDASITFSGGGYTDTFSSNLRVSADGKVEVEKPNDDRLRVKIDRESGRFQTKLEIGDSGKVLKATGVIVQGSGLSGAGVFKGPTQTGKIALTLGSIVPPTPEPPTPNPPVEPDPPLDPDPLL